jgi:hypothetical protein
MSFHPVCLPGEQSTLKEEEETAKQSGRCQMPSNRTDTSLNNSCAKSLP